MALQIRRGTESLRTTINPAEGEIIYTTDTKKMYIGDGITAGGTPVTSIETDTTPKLGGPLDVNGRIITSSSNGNITILPNGTGTLNFQNTLKLNNTGDFEKTGTLYVSPTQGTVFGNTSLGIDGAVTIVRQNYNANANGFIFQQNHSTADGNNFAFSRGRGTFASPTIIQQGDDIIDITFAGYDGNTYWVGAALSAIIDGIPAAGKMPTKLTFGTNNGTSFGVRAALSSAGTWQVDNLGSLSTKNISLPTDNTLTVGDVRLSQNGLASVNSNANLFLNANGTGRISLDGMLWPATDGTNGQILTTDGSGSLSWTSASASLSSRATFSVTTSSIADQASTNATITSVYKGYILLNIQVDRAAWVRIYTDTASRTADASRAEGVDPAPGAGVIAEVITTGSQTILMSPGVLGWNNEGVPTTDVQIAVKNKSGSTSTVTVTITAIKIEA